jgi:hypothetical protein
MKREGVVTSIEKKKKKRIQRNTAAGQEIGFYRNWCNRQATTLAQKGKKERNRLPSSHCIEKGLHNKTKRGFSLAIY